MSYNFFKKKIIVALTFLFLGFLFGDGKLYAFHSSWEMVSAEKPHFCQQSKSRSMFMALLKDETTVIPWGYNYRDELNVIIPDLCHRSWGEYVEFEPKHKIIDLVPNSINSFTALFDDGAIQSWAYDQPGNDEWYIESTFHQYWDPGYSDFTPAIRYGHKVVGVASANSAFSVLFDDGKIQSWGGDAEYGVAHMTPEIPKGRRAIAIASVAAYDAFAALLDDGTIESWDVDNSSYITPEIPKGCKVLGITSTAFAFAALLDNGTIQLWGGTNKTLEIPAGRKVVTLAASDCDFVGILDDGTMYLWPAKDLDGKFNNVSGGLLPEIPEGRKVIALASTSCNFTALLDDSTIQSWGASWGVLHQITPEIPEGRKVVGLASNSNAFTALLDNGTIISWGHPSFGGITPNISEGRKVISISSTTAGFAAILDNGTIQSWGEDVAGVPKIPQGKKVDFVSGGASFYRVRSSQCNTASCAWSS